MLIKHVFLKKLKIFENTSREIFEQIVNQSIIITCELIQQMIFANQSVFSKEYVISLLKKPHITDDIFKKFFTAMGVNIESLWEPIQNDNIIADDYDDAIMTTSFILGILLDKYFFSIYGYFLKLIQPLYTLTSDFHKNLSYIKGMSYDDLTTALHSPCSTYSITKLGMEYFSVNIPPIENNLINSTISIDLLTATVLSKALDQKDDDNNSNNNIQKTNKICNENPGTIYSLKVKLLDYPEYWKVFDIPSVFSLHKLHEFISDEFEL